MLFNLSPLAEVSDSPPPGTAALALAERKDYTLPALDLQDFILTAASRLSGIQYRLFEDVSHGSDHRYPSLDSPDQLASVEALFSTWGVATVRELVTLGGSGKNLAVPGLRLYPGSTSPLSEMLSIYAQAIPGSEVVVVDHPERPNPTYSEDRNQIILPTAHLLSATHFEIADSLRHEIFHGLTSLRLLNKLPFSFYGYREIIHENGAQTQEPFPYAGDFSFDEVAALQDSTMQAYLSPEHLIFARTRMTQFLVEGSILVQVLRAESRTPQFSSHSDGTVWGALRWRHLTDNSILTIKLPLIHSRGVADPDNELYWERQVGAFARDITNRAYFFESWRNDRMDCWSRGLEDRTDLLEAEKAIALQVLERLSLYTPEANPTPRTLPFCDAAVALTKEDSIAAILVADSLPHLDPGDNFRGVCAALYGEGLCRSHRLRAISELLRDATPGSPALRFLRRSIMNLENDVFGTVLEWASSPNTPHFGAARSLLIHVTPAMLRNRCQDLLRDPSLAPSFKEAALSMLPTDTFQEHPRFLASLARDATADSLPLLANVARVSPYFLFTIERGGGAERLLPYLSSEELVSLIDGDNPDVARTASHLLALRAPS